MEGAELGMVTLSLSVPNTLDPTQEVRQTQKTQPFFNLSIQTMSKDVQFFSSISWYLELGEIYHMNCLYYVDDKQALQAFFHKLWHKIVILFALRDFIEI